MAHPLSVFLYPLKIMCSRRIFTNCGEIIYLIAEKQHLFCTESLLFL